MRFFDRTKPAICLLLLALAAGAATGQTLARKNWAGSGITVEPWWQGIVLYQIDPLSFQDSGDDGFGDLQGIIQRLDYLQSLGVDALVLSPLPLQSDFGRKPGAPPFDPKYGSADDLDQLVQETTRRKIRLFVDLPLSPVRSTPDTLSIARFWLSRGMAGLRLTIEPGHADALTEAQLADRTRQLEKLCATFAGQRVLFSDLPAPSEEPSATETPAPGRYRSHRKLRTANTFAATTDPAQMEIDARLAQLTQLNAAGLRSALTPAPLSASQTAVPETDTPDKPRSLDRFGDGEHDSGIAKLLATALLTARGSPLLYFGQEIGIAATPTPNAGAAGGTADPSPMQWGGDAGFSKGTPWMEMARNAATANVTLEDADADSLLNWYRKLSALRHANPALRSGTMDLIAQSNPDVVAWVRRVPAAISTTVPVLVVCNMTSRPLLVSLRADLQQLGLETGSGMLHTLASSALSAASAGLGTKLGPDAKEPVTGPVAMTGISLPPYGVYVGELPHQPGIDPAPPRRGYRGAGSKASR